MKCYYKITIIFLFLPLWVFGKDYKKYISYTNYAELAIVKDDYKLAERYYDTAFQFWNKPFAIDIYNYLKCANLDYNYSTVKLLAEKLITLGCELSFFEKAEYLSGFRTSNEWKRLINNYASLYKKYVVKNNWQLREQILQMQSRDQRLRRLNPAYTFLKDSIYKADDSIKEDLIKIFKEKFPNEYEYGVFLSDDTTLSILHPLEIILIHNYGKFDSTMLPDYNQRNMNFTSVLLKNVKNGNMSPEIFGLLNDRSGKFMIGSGFGQDDILINNNNKLYYYKRTPAIWNEIEKNRAQIGLCSSEQGREKLIYMAIKNKNNFMLRKSMSQITTYSENIPEKALSYLYIYTGISMK